jgi:hypothetical protein
MLPAFLNLSFDVLSVICRLHNFRSPFKIPFYLVSPIVSRLGQKHYFTWGPYAAFHGMSLPCHIEGSMITAVWTHLHMFLNSKFHHFRVKCWILLKPVLEGVDGNFHFPVPSMNRLNQTEPATFSILLCWTFFRDSVLLYFIVTSVLFVPCGGCKKSPGTFNQWCYIFDPFWSFSTTLLLCIHVMWYF